MLKPFLKWAGGKRQIVDLLINNMPKSWNVYIEPFVGSGALFFRVMPDKAIISDINPELMNVYKVIRDNVYELIKDLEKHENSSDYYYNIRDNVDLSKMSEIERASRFIYLNKTCYNGLYRENSDGKFNVPYGKYKKVKIFDKDNLIKISEYLNDKDIQILCSDFENVCGLAGEGDFVFLDPPYYSDGKVSKFTQYNKKTFDANDHIRLKKVIDELTKRDVYVMHTNSNTDFVLNLYKEYNVKKIYTNRFINSDPNNRGKEQYEVIITNYK
ncbi:MAG: DNA adenine methylase [Candidatus Methanomethylicia archaeon]